MSKNSKASPKKKSAPARTPVRNTAIPKPSAKASKRPIAITRDQIALKAYFIHISGTGGSESDNWLRAERDLRSGL